MKTFATLLCAAALLSPAALTAASFEGKVTMTMTAAKGAPTPINFSVKPGFSRMDMQADGHTATIIFDLTKEEMMILMAEQKMYMTRAMPKPKADSAPDSGKPGDAVVEKTGVTEKILGYTCTKYISKDKDTTTEMWVTDELGTFIGMSNGAAMGGRRGGGAPKQAWEEALQGKDSFPLRVVTTSNKDKSGKETFRMEATAIDKQKLPASLFAAPEDFQKLDLGGMMRGMIPGFGK